MPQELFRQVSFNNGELDPLMRARRDTKNYFASLEYAENIVTTPGGPFSNRPGLLFVDYARHTLAAVPIDAGMVTAPVGGTVADVLAIDGASLTTTTDLGAGDQVLLSLDFGQPVEIAALDLVDFAVKGNGGADTVKPPPFTFPWGTVVNTPFGSFTL